MLTRNLEKAREAFKHRNPATSQLAHSHQPEEHKQEQGQHLKSIVYGGLDGIITTFAIVAGVAGAALSSGVVLILGFANLIADGLSMAIGDYTSTRAENQYFASERQRELWEVENYPDGEKQELLDLYINKGISPPDAEAIVALISKNKKAWVDIMMVEELGIIESSESPLKNALATFLSFVVLGFVPLAVFVLSYFIPWLKPNAFYFAVAMTGITLFGLGAFQSRFTGQNWLKSGTEIVLIGGIAAAAAFLIGFLLSGLAQA
ncbi:MAG: hypothetical protein EHM72_04215 [Calditrichaeota bacterium]|nr:MAG: hypothetical protein EHM72_04215 [Calditrichota bacterium]